MGSEGSIGSIRSAGSGQSTEGTNGQSTSILIENARVGASPSSLRAAAPGLARAGDGAPARSLAKEGLYELSVLHQTPICCQNSAGRCSWRVPSCPA